jgi:hypothetical protein
MKHFLLFLLIILSLSGCKKKTEEKTVYKLSEDICYACANASFSVIGEDTILISGLITANDDDFNDLFTIKYLDAIISPLPINLTIFDRDGNQIIHFDDYKNSWPPYIPGYEQNITGLSNGLYKYVLSKGLNQIKGYLIILLKKDDYIDKHYLDLPCHQCIIFDMADPLLI